MTEKLDLLHLLWMLLRNQPPEHLLVMAPWHLLALLSGLGLLSAFGLHFLVGYALHFYRVNRPVARWVSVPMALIWLVAVQLLLVAYLIAANGPALVSPNLEREASPSEAIGRYLLQPAFEGPEGLGADLVAKLDVLSTLNRQTGEQYRDALLRFREAPERLAAPLGKGTAQDTRRVMEQIGLQWLTDSDQVTVPLVNPVEGEAAAPAQPLFLPGLVERLLGDLRDTDVLSRENWEFVAGTRFVSEFLAPLMVEYLQWIGRGLAASVTVVALLLIAIIARLRLWRVRKGKVASSKASTKVSGVASAGSSAIAAASKPAGLSASKAPGPVAASPPAASQTGSAASTGPAPGSASASLSPGSAVAAPKVPSPPAAAGSGNAASGTSSSAAGVGSAPSTAAASSAPIPTPSPSTAATGSAAPSPAKSDQDKAGSKPEAAKPAASPAPAGGTAAGASAATLAGTGTGPSAVGSASTGAGKQPGQADEKATPSAPTRTPAVTADKVTTPDKSTSDKDTTPDKSAAPKTVPASPPRASKTGRVGDVLKRWWPF